MDWPFNASYRLLVDERAKGGAALKAKIDHYMDDFVSQAGAEASPGHIRCAVEVFALVYAADRLAANYGVLPVGFQPGSAVLACYRLHPAEMERSVPFEDRLKAVADDGRTMRLQPREQVTTAVAASENAFLRQEKRGLELFVLEGKIHQVFLD